LAVGCDQFVRKPVSFENLVKIVHRYVPASMLPCLAAMHANG